jgi:hypothetical protein
MAGAEQAMEALQRSVAGVAAGRAAPAREAQAAQTDPGSALQTQAAAAVTRAQAQATALRGRVGGARGSGCSGGPSRRPSRFAPDPVDLGSPPPAHAGGGGLPPVPSGGPGIDRHLAAAAAGSGPQAEQTVHLSSLQVLSQPGAGRGGRRDDPADFDDYAFRLLGGGGRGDAGDDLGGRGGSKQTWRACQVIQKDPRLRPPTSASA